MCIGYTIWCEKHASSCFFVAKWSEHLNSIPCWSPGEDKCFSDKKLLPVGGRPCMWLN